MRILLDTHAFIWWDDQQNLLSLKALSLCQDSSNTLLISVASIWEMQIKIQLGKLNFSLPLKQKIDDQRRTNGLQLLPIKIKHIYTLEQLANHHRDPFDRLLVAQCINENIPIISNDINVAKYPITALW